MATAIEIRPVEPATIERVGFFCRKSKMKATGNLRNVRRATEQMGNGLGIEILYEDGPSAADVQARAPSPYGVFGVVLDGELLSYHYLLEKDLRALIAERS